MWGRPGREVLCAHTDAQIKEVHFAFMRTRVGYAGSAAAGTGRPLIADIIRLYTNKNTHTELYIPNHIDRLMLMKTYTVKDKGQRLSVAEFL